MTEETLPLAELLAKAGDGDFLRSVAEAVVQLLMETDVEGLIGAGRHEPTGDRMTYRNGYGERTLHTRLGSLQLRIPKLRQGSYFPPFLEPRKTTEKALVAVIQEASISGVCTRRVDELVQAMGGGGQGSIGLLMEYRRRAVGHQQEHGFEAVQGHRRSRRCLPRSPARRRVGVSVARCHPRLRGGRLYLKQREGGRIVSVAATIAVAVNTDGKREILGLHIGPSEPETFWSSFLYTIVQTAKLNGINPEADLKDGLAKIAEAHPTNRIHELLPWHWQTPKQAAA